MVRCPNCFCESVFHPLPAPFAETSTCSSCGGWSFHGVVETAPHNLYSQSYFRGDEYLDYERTSDIQKQNFRRKLTILTRFLPQNTQQRWLEVGAATGLFYEVLREQLQVGKESYFGIEVSDYARLRASERYEIELHSPGEANLISAIEEFNPTVIIAWDVWEHLPNPASTFAEITQAASAHCFVALTTVDSGSFVAHHRGARWRQYHPPTHLNYPSRDSFRRFFSTLSFETAYHRSFGYTRSVAEYLTVFGVIGEMIIASLPCLYSLPAYLNLGDTQFVIAHRTSAR